MKYVFSDILWNDMIIIQIVEFLFLQDRKEAEAKDMEHTQKYKEAFEKIKKVAPADSNLDKIVADFIKVEDQNFALFNYVTEMNNQVSSH